jgi:hypothetical protein
MSTIDHSHARARADTSDTDETADVQAKLVLSLRQGRALGSAKTADIAARHAAPSALRGDGTLATRAAVVEVEGDREPRVGVDEQEDERADQVHDPDRGPGEEEQDVPAHGCRACN